LAIRLAQQAFDLARPSDLRTRSYAQFLTGSAHRNRGRFRLALQAFARGLSLFATADREPDTVSTTWPIYVSLSSWGAAEAHAMLGEFDQAIEWGVRGCRVADEIGNAGSRVLAATFQGHVYVLKGEPDSALRSMEPRMPLAEELGQGHLSIKFFLVLSHTYLLLGRADEGLRHLRRALASTRGFMAESTRFGTLTASALMEAGRLDEASAEVAAGLAHSEKTGADGHRAPLLRLQAEMLARRDPPEPGPAQQSWREGLHLAIVLGMRPEVAHCHLGLGKLYRRAGDHAKASEHLSTATTMYREMDMGFWLGRAAAALDPLGSDASRADASP
jgi:tetratricopeptide (TPR) repeat protein